jgi:hypothetical protein
MRYRAVLFDVGGPLDLEFAWEIAVDGAIASACGLEGIRGRPASSVGGVVAVEDLGERQLRGMARPASIANLRGPRL